MRHVIVSEDKSVKCRPSVGTLDDAVDGVRERKEQENTDIISIVNTIHYIAYLQG